MDPRMRYENNRRCGRRGNRWHQRPRLPHSERTSAQNTSSDTSASGGTSENTESLTTAQHSLPNNFNRFKMGSINWALWVCFIVVTALLVPAHIYLKQYAYRGELMGFFFVITLLVLVCFSVSMFHTKTRTILLHRLHVEEELGNCPVNTADQSGAQDVQQSFSVDVVNERRIRPFQMRSSHSNPELAGNEYSRIDIHESSRRLLASIRRAGRAQRTEAPPPPYEIAVLLPQTDSKANRSETPPPEYNRLY